MTDLPSEPAYLYWRRCQQLTRRRLLPNIVGIDHHDDLRLSQSRRLRTVGHDRRRWAYRRVLGRRFVASERPQRRNRSERLRASRAWENCVICNCEDWRAVIERLRPPYRISVPEEELPSIH